MSRIQLIPYATIISFSILLCSILLPLNIVQQVDWFLSDQMVSSLNTDRQPSDRVKLILIDDISVNQLSPVLGRYPWPRGVYAPIIEFLNAGNAKHIYFDILFSEFEESTASHTEFVNMLKQAGYLGASEEEIVDRWFQTLCRTIGNEQGIDVTGSGYVQINRNNDGTTDVS